MATLFRRGKIWWIDAGVAGQRLRWSLDTTDERIARHKLKKHEYEQVTGDLTLPSVTPLAPFLQAFCEHLEAARSHKGYKNDVSYLRTFFGPVCDALQPKSTLNRDHVPKKPISGKTVALWNALPQLRKHGTKFVVLETAKTEYRALKMLRQSADPRARELAEGLRVWSPLRESLAPLRLNPLWYPAGITRDEHIENLLVCFQAAMPLMPPLPALIGEGLEDVYEKRTDAAEPPVMQDLYAATRAVLARKGYSAELASDLRAALEVRLGMLTRRTIGRIFQCRNSMPSIADLMDSYSVIEMDPLSTAPEHGQQLRGIPGDHGGLRAAPLRAVRRTAGPVRDHLRRPVTVSPGRLAGTGSPGGSSQAGGAPWALNRPRRSAKGIMPNV
jgi:hypothetical protein